MRKIIIDRIKNITPNGRLDYIYRRRSETYEQSFADYIDNLDDKDLVDLLCRVVIAETRRGVS